MAQTFYINTATKEYSKDNITWYSVSSFKTTRNATVVIFNEQEDAIGNDTYSDEVMKIDVTADTITIDGSTTRAPGYFTTATLVAYLQSVFPKANSGNGGSGVDYTSFTEYSDATGIADTDVIPASITGNTRKITFLTLWFWIAKNLQAWSGRYNIRYYGAKMDGTTDDTDSLINAIAASGGTGEIFIPKGTAYLNKLGGGGIALPSDAAGLTIKGAGKGQTVIKLSKNVPRAFDFIGINSTSQTKLYQNISIQDFTIDANNITSGSMGASVAATATATGVNGGFINVSVADNSSYVSSGVVYFPTTNTGTTKGLFRTFQKGGTGIIQVALSASETIVSGDTMIAANSNSIIGNYGSGGYGLARTNCEFSNIAIQDIDIINLASTPPTVANPVAFPVNLRGVALLGNVASGFTGTLTTQDITIKRVRIKGGASGIDISSTSSAGRNYLKNIALEDCFHDVLVPPTVQYASSNFLISNTGYGTNVSMRRCTGINSGDVGAETDITDIVLEDCLMIDSYGSPYNTINYSPPANTILGATYTTVSNGAAAITNVQTTIPVASFPTTVANNGYIAIDNELMYYQYSGTTTLSVTRGLNQTAAVTHADGAKVVFIEIEKQKINYIRCRAENKTLAYNYSNGFRVTRNTTYPLPPILLRDCSYLRETSDLGANGEAVYIEGQSDVTIDNFVCNIKGVNVPTSTSKQKSVIYLQNRDWDVSNGVASKIPPVTVKLRNIQINAGGILDNAGNANFYGIRLGQGNFKLDWKSLDIRLNFLSTAQNQARGIGLDFSSSYISGNVDGYKFSATGGVSPIGTIMQNATFGRLSFDNQDFTELVFGSPTTNSNYKPWFLDLTSATARNVFFGNVKHSLTSVLPGARRQLKSVTVAATPYTHTFAEDIVNVTNAAATTITLAAVEAGGSTSKLSYGYELTINDAAFAAATNNITLTPASGEKINNSTSSFVIATNGASVTLQAIPGGWIVKSKNY